MNADNTTARWRRIRELFQQSLAQPIAEQATFLKAAAGDDKRLFDEVSKLLDAAQNTGQELTDVISEAAADASKTQTGEFIHQYRIVSLLGEGGMGQVYLAERGDDQYQQQVAIKVLGVRRPTDELVQRFRTERQMLATLNHVSIARLLDGGETEDGAPFLVMEYVDGESVDHYCDNQSLDTRERLTMFVKICAAVDHAHRNLIIHRDIKPSNIMVNRDGEPKLLDFGIAKLLEADSDVLQTRSNARMMSPLHASPEQVRGEQISVASDIYSLGVLLYQILTGQHPYMMRSNTPAEVERVICETDPLKPSSRVTGSGNASDVDLLRIAEARSTKIAELARTMDGDLDNIVLMAMNKEPDRRYASVREFVADIQRFLDQRPVSARPTSLAYRARLFLRRNRLPSAIAALASVAIVASITFSINRIANERDIATAERQKAEAVSEFLQSVFNGANPNYAQGEETTARQLLDYGAIQIGQDLEDQPALRAVMLRVLGEAFYGFSNLDRAEALLSDAKRTIEQQATPALDELATIELMLGMIQQDRSNYDEAAAIYSQVRESRAQLFGQDSVEFVEVILLQAHLTEFQGDLREARALFEEGLAISRRLTDGDDAHVAELQSKLAAVHRQQGNNDEAERLLENAMAMQERIYSNQHPRFLETQRYLADLYRAQDRFEEAQALYLENISTRVKVLGADHLEVGNAYNEYSILLSNMDDIDGAVKASKEFLRILDVNYDEPSAGYGAAQNNLAWLQHAQEDYDGAIESFQKAIEVQDVIGLDSDHIHRSFPIYGVAVAALSQDDYAVAARQFERALPMRRQHFDESSLLVSQVKSGLGGALVGLGRHAEAEEILVDALEHLTEQQGDAHAETKIATERLALARAQQ
ncbi:MAG: serine/threonine-protein kinase [Gammaproteobacteria bacterium]|nr:serine/threonine-protein kinase [Gammaproteobacteria bacterium]